MECLALTLTFRTKASTLRHSDLCPLRYRLSGARMRTHFLGRLKSSPHGDRKGSPLLYTVGTLGMRRSRGVTTLRSPWSGAVAMPSFLTSYGLLSRPAEFREISCTKLLYALNRQPAGSYHPLWLHRKETVGNGKGRDAASNQYI